MFLRETVTEAARVGGSLTRIWLHLRLFTLLCAVVAGAFFTLTEVERTVAAWPPSEPYTRWLGRVLLAPFDRWDAEYYINIVSRGYRTDDGTAAFHPLLAWLSAPFAWLTGSPLFGLMLVSSLAGLFSYHAFERLAALDQNAQTARTSTLLYAFFPASFVLFIPYTESLMLLWGILCFLCARRGRWWLAGLAGGLAALTKQQGVFLALPLAWELWEASGRDWREALRRWREWAALGLIPAGLLVWLVYRSIALDDFRPDFTSFNSFIYTTVLSPSSQKVVGDQGFMWPWKAAWLAFKSAMHFQRLDTWLTLLLGLAFVPLAALAWKHLRTSYRLYVLLIFLVTFSYHTGMNNTSGAYISLPRHLLLAFPIFIGLGARCDARLRPFIVALGLFGIAFLLFGHISRLILT